MLYKIESENDLKYRRNIKILFGMILSPILIVLMIELYLNNKLPLINDLILVPLNEVYKIEYSTERNVETLYFTLLDKKRIVSYSSSQPKYHEIKEYILNANGEVVLGIHPVFKNYKFGTVLSKIITVNINGVYKLTYEDSRLHAEKNGNEYMIVIILAAIGGIFLFWLYFIAGKRRSDVIYMQDVLK